MSSTAEDNKTLTAFWDGAFAMSEEDMEEARRSGAGSLAELAPSVKLFEAARELGARKKVLDYGCGSAWAAVIAAKSGCEDVTAADPAPGAVRAAELCAELFGVSDRVHELCAGSDWLKAEPSGTYDGFICSNVLDVVPPETAAEIIREAARVVTADAEVIFGLNYYLSPADAEAKGIELADGRRLYRDGVLRLVSRSDGEWAELFSPYFTVLKLDHFAWPGETDERRRLFYLRRRNGNDA